jgi:hypothetical protein
MMHIRFGVPSFGFGEIKRGREDLHDARRSGRGRIESLTAQIKVLLDENCFVSARSIAETLQVSHSSVLKHLHQDLGFQFFHLRLVPHMSTPELKEQRPTYATEMIVVLLSAQKDGWHHLVSGDESWPRVTSFFWAQERRTERNGLSRRGMAFVGAF